MPVSIAVTDFRCPKCSRRVDPGGVRGAEVRCPYCKWSGRVYLFSPLVKQVDRQEEAMPSDATCAHHPTKQAEVICAGSGDYICALCKIEIDGIAYSAQYLDKVGRDKLKKAFDRYLERPDRSIKHAGILFIIPWLNLLGVIAWPYLIYKYVQMMRKRSESRLYARLVGRGDVWVCRVLLALYGLLFIGGVVLLLIAITKG